jgi:hypothetical protein
MYGSPLGKRWPGTGKLVCDLGALHSLADASSPGKVLLNATGNESLTPPASDPPPLWGGFRRGDRGGRNTHQSVAGRRRTNDTCKSRSHRSHRLRRRWERAHRLSSRIPRTSARATLSRSSRILRLTCSSVPMSRNLGCIPGNDIHKLASRYPSDAPNQSCDAKRRALAPYFVIRPDLAVPSRHGARHLGSCYVFL